MIIKIDRLAEDAYYALLSSKTFEGDELTSAVSQAIIYLQELQQKEKVV